MCWKENGKVVRTVHLGSAGNEEGIAKLVKKGREIMDAGKTPMFDLDDFNAETSASDD